MMRFGACSGGCLVLALSLAACDATPVIDDAGSDAGRPDGGRAPIPSLDHCTFTAVPPTGGAGGTVSEGTLRAGVAEHLIDVPLGGTLSAYTSRSEGFGAEGFVEDERDRRRTYLAGSWAPSIGIETIPRIRALALEAGGERVVILKLDLGFAYQGFLHEVEAELGPEYSGKVMVATSHTHNSFGHYTGHSGLQGGAGRFRSSVYRPLIAQMVATAREALDALEPARIGFSYDGEFDRDDRVNRDRRGANDELAGGREDDHHLFVIRVDTLAGEPMALVPVFGMHGTIGGGDNAILSADSSGGVDRVLEETFDRPVLVMHLQGAGGDVSPAGRSGIDCRGALVCSDFARAETIGHFGRDEIVAAWEAAGTAMQSEIAIEMLTRTVPLGPDPSTFRIRNGDLEYAPFDLRRRPDGVIYNDDGSLASPIDEFNAPYGVALCDSERLALPRAIMPGAADLRGTTYYGCNRIEGAAGVFSTILDIELEAPPLCETTQTTVSALRLGDWMVGALPGEPITLLANRLRTLSPMPAERTIVVGYAQDHIGYLMTAEDWLLGGYEPSITWWGPLEGEYVAEQVAALMPLAVTPEREDGNAAGIARVAARQVMDDFPRDVLSGPPGRVPATLPPYILTRLLRPVPSAQPAATVPRLGTVFFTWIGEDPMDGTPRAILQRETDPDVFEDVLRRSGRPVMDGDIVLTWTPDPILPQAGVERTHYFTVELQAAAPLGMPGLEALVDRAGLPLGRYRFRIEGTGYELTSAPFEVVAGALDLTSEVAGADLRVTARYTALEGYRLLDLQVVSNGPVPLRGAELTVVVDGADPITLTADSNGAFTIPGAASASSVIVRDRFDNAGTL